MMTYCSISNDRKKSHGEVFTPPGIVFKMLMMPELTADLKNAEQKFFDPSAGKGQFSCAALVLKMFYNLDKLNAESALTALDSLSGMDIQAESVKKCKKHMLETLNAAYKFFTGADFTNCFEAEKIIENNFKAGDSLNFMTDFSQSKLF